MSDFEAYLSKKKIDSEAFKAHDPELWEAWKVLFGQVHPESFTAQKLFLINAVRRRFPLLESKKPRK